MTIIGQIKDRKKNKSMLGIDLEKMWKDKIRETLTDFLWELALQDIDFLYYILENEREILLEEAKERLDIEFKKMMNNPIICKDIDTQNNLIRQRNFLLQKSYNPKKKNEKKKK